MTDLNKKERLIAILCYLAFSAVLTFQRHYLLALVYFACVGVVILFADKLIQHDALSSKTLCAFFITAVGYQTTFEIFFADHESFNQILSAVAVAVFFAGIFALTDEKMLPWCIGAIPLLCVLNIKLAIGLSVLMLCLSIVRLKHFANLKSRDRTLLVTSVVVSILGVAIGVILTVISDKYFLEGYNYLLQRFKNPVFLLAVTVYLTVKLLRSKFQAKRNFFICLAVIIASTVFTTLTLGWSSFALFCFIAPVFVGLLCLRDKKIVKQIKADYEKHKFIFWTTLVCILQ
ncbi:MAG: hypothetical protein IKT61_02350 [Clostridia bacterium]|nr:hypothetical protein [Clostridia bacterium]